MKIAALTPQFVVEAPPGEETKDAARAKRQLSIAKVEAPSQASDQKTDQETRNGLKRLAEFISSQRKAPEHAVPEAPTPELRERRADENSHEFTKLILAWSQRPVIINSMAQVVADEMRRRRGMKAYKNMQAVRKDGASKDEVPGREIVIRATDEVDDLPPLLTGS